MQGIGNDFVMLDALRALDLPADLPALAQWTNDRKFGIGADGLILLERGETAPFRMRMFNPDGSESEMCGNGIRCFAKLLRDHGHTTESSVSVETGAGTLVVELLDSGAVRVDMGLARITRGGIGMIGEAAETFIDQPIDVRYKGTGVSMGNPHLVIFVADAMSVPLVEDGSRLEHHPLFPARTNVHFAEVEDRGHIVQRTWERGAGVTLACGTGACSVAVAGVLTGRTDRDVVITLPGGKLRVEYGEDERVFMTGPAETVFTGSFSWPI
jgi:diaminopimelate epimerase